MSYDFLYNCIYVFAVIQTLFLHCFAHPMISVEQGGPGVFSGGVTDT